MKKWILFSLTLSLYSGLLARKIEVGPSSKYKTPSAASKVVRNGDTVWIQAGIYPGDVAFWKANNLFISGKGGRAHLKSGGRAAGKKAIWVIQGNNTVIENIEFSGCKVPDHNGAGIRQEGINLRIGNCYFHDNEEGILAGNNPNSTIIIEHSEFSHNGYGRGYTHHIYINHVDSCIVRYCYFHHANVGHHIKSRAQNTLIAYNKIIDDKTGNSSRLIDIPNGGNATVIGNFMQQGPKAENNNMVGFGLEGLSNAGTHILYMVHNTLVNERHSCVFVMLKSGAEAYLINNAFAGKGTLLSGKSRRMSNNYKDADISRFKFMDVATYDYSLLKTSPLIDRGTRNYSLPNHLKVTHQYVHPLSKMIREFDHADSVDIGAFEFHKTTANAAPLSKADVSIYPNPCNTGRIYFTIPVEKYEMAIYDLRGHTLSYEKIPKGVRLKSPGFKGFGIVRLRHNNRNLALRFFMK